MGQSRYRIYRYRPKIYKSNATADRELLRRPCKWGKLYKPYLIKKIVDSDGGVKATEPGYEDLGISRASLDTVREGMIRVSERSPGRFAKLESKGIKTAVKTGTAEVGDERNRNGQQVKSSNAIYMCYAPAEDPQIAIAVVMERGVWGANAAPIVVEMLEKYFDTDGEKPPEDDKIHANAGADFF